MWTRKPLLLSQNVASLIQWCPSAPGGGVKVSRIFSHIWVKVFNKKLSPAARKIVRSPHQGETTVENRVLFSSKCQYWLKVALLSPLARHGVLCVIPEGVLLREKVGGRVPKSVRVSCRCRKRAFLAFA